MDKDIKVGIFKGGIIMKNLVIEIMIKEVRREKAYEVDCIYCLGARTTILMIQQR